MRGVFVTGTDTGAGKTIVATALAATLTARGVRVAAYKPVVTGEPHPDAGWPPDHELLAAATGSRSELVTPLRFGLAASPHLAAELAGTTIVPRALVDAAAAAAAGASVLVVEGVGGLLVPLALDYSVRDFARDLGLPLVVAARPGLGTISHTRLTVEAARAAGLDVRAVVLTPWPAVPSTMEQSNAQTIAHTCGVQVAFLPHVEHPEIGLLAAAAASLPVERWLGP